MYGRTLTYVPHSLIGDEPASTGTHEAGNVPPKGITSTSALESRTARRVPRVGEESRTRAPAGGVPSRGFPFRAPSEFPPEPCTRCCRVAHMLGHRTLAGATAPRAADMPSVSQPIDVPSAVRARHAHSVCDSSRDVGFRAPGDCLALDDAVSGNESQATFGVRATCSVTGVGFDCDIESRPDDHGELRLTGSELSSSPLLLEPDTGLLLLASVDSRYCMSISPSPRSSGSRCIDSESS